MNNQHQIAMAIQQYDGAKQRLPGYINALTKQANGSYLCSGWPPVLLPFMGRTDLWEGSSGANGWRSGNPLPAVSTRINEFVCPDDKGNTAACPLSYVVNIGVYNQDPLSPPPMAVGQLGGMLLPPPSPYLFQDYSLGTSTAISLSAVKTPARTIMLGEKIVTGSNRDWTYSPSAPLTPPNQILPRFLPLYTNAFGFTWPYSPTVSGWPGGLSQATLTNLQNVTIGTTMPGAAAVGPCGGRHRHVL